MEATAVSLARSVLDGVLNRAGSAVADEAALLLGVRREVEFIRDELDMMRSFLKVATANPDADDTVRTWVKQVRDLAYDVEDSLLDFALFADTLSSSSSSSWWLPWRIAERHRVAARIRELKASVEELNQRFLRYRIVVEHPRASRGGGASDDQQQLHDHDGQYYSAELAFQESDIIGRAREKAEVTALVLSGCGGGDVVGGGALGVVSVWGMGGMGKSSLVRMVYNDPELLDAFDCDAWVTVPHPLDSADEFVRRLRRHLAVGKDQDVHAYLREKRYVIIVDDLHSREEWEHIWPVLHVDGGKGSRVVVTTRREDVARHCAGLVREGHGHVYELRPLGREESKDLFCQKVYKSTEYILEKEMEDLAGPILKRCRGLPLAISTIGGLLANRPKTGIEWIKLDEHLGAELESSDLRNITKVIVSSYDGLPYYLKSIFLYLSIFPENHEIRCTRLLRRWMAEGFIAKNRDMPVEEVGQRFYNELINRSMIQPSKKRISPSVSVDRCRVHSMVLQIILSKSIEENQLFIIKKHCNEVPQSKIRHLVVSRWKRRDERLENINFSYVRSLTVFGDCPASLISPKMRLLRVLDLEDSLNLKNEDLRHVGELHHLRYLCLRGTEISKLPSFQNLRYLETLDIQDTKVTQLPDGIAKLEKLRYLLAGVNFSKELLHKVEQPETDNRKANQLGNMLSCLYCNSSDYCGISSLDRVSVRAPEGVEKLRDLHMLGVINVGHGNGVVGKIKKLTNLRRLGVSGVLKEEGQDLCKSIEKLSRLQRLELRSDSLKFLAESEFAAPKHLLSLRLYGNLVRLPKWIGSLNDLAKLKLLGTQLKQGEIMHLGKLRNLAFLGLWDNSYVGYSLHFGPGTFPKLKFLDIDGLKNIETVAIENGAMPELEQLWVNDCKGLLDSKDGLSGVPHLTNLNELLVKKCGEKENLMEILQTQVSEHSKRPKFLIEYFVWLVTEESKAEQSKARREMEATAVSLARTVLDGVLGGAGSAVADEAALLLGVPREVDFIRSELEMMQSFLRATSGCAGDTARTWVKQVRDLAYDVEDCLLDFALHAHAHASSSSCAPPLWLRPWRLAERHRVAARIRELKASVEELNQRNHRYHVVPVLAAGDQQQQQHEPPAAPPPARGEQHHLRFRDWQVIGRGEEESELAKLISSGGDDDAETRRRVVSVWGMGGMGKSSVARSVYNDPAIVDGFDCRAWVTVPHPLDSAGEFKRRLVAQLETEVDGGGGGDDVSAWLRQKRYLIVVDDVRSLEEWEHIEPCLVESDAGGGRVIVTTRQVDVAQRCVRGMEHAYELKTLAAPHDMRLLCQKVYKDPEYTLQLHMLEEANKILGRCRGLPLAIATIGGLLANRPKTSAEWKNLRIHLGSELEFDQDINSINRVITSSYDGLPYHLKSCFLYLSIFPENHEIRYTRLVRRWIAEGYIAKRRDMTVEEVGQKHYNDLMNRSMIRPMKKKIGASMAVERCQVHGMVLQIILSKSIEENQLFIIDKHCNEVPQSKIRHLVVTRWKRSEEKMATNINLSLVRSLTVFGECPASLISPKLRLLRVLDLENAVDLENDDLKHIGDLHHLRYLGLRGTNISRLPSSLQNLKCLETLDVQDTKVTHLPDGTAKLEKLRYLLAGINFAEDLAEKMQTNAKNKATSVAPEGIEKLRNLHMLGVVRIERDSGVAQKLGKLISLRRLGVDLDATGEEGKALCNSIQKLARLERLEVRSKSLLFLNDLNGLAPKHLLSLRLYGHLEKLPDWVSSLNDLAKVKLLETQLEQKDINLLGNLSNLTSLGLWGKSFAGVSLHFSRDMFKNLKSLHIQGLENLETLNFEKSAADRLEKLLVKKCFALSDNERGISDILFLKNIVEITLISKGDKPHLQKGLQRQVSEFELVNKRRPKLQIVNSMSGRSPRANTIVG
uniref:Uncharacterized protein n=1 Tax=Oryza rufipogon TaxID=4529 RepID=A0A0E0QTW0_ORYRU